MLFNKTVAVVVPAYNEEKQIARVLATMPEFVDRIIVVNDCSSDNTADVVLSCIQQQCVPGATISASNTQYDGNQ